MSPGDDQYYYVNFGDNLTSLFVASWKKIISVWEKQENLKTLRCARWEGKKKMTHKAPHYTQAFSFSRN